MRNQKVAFSRTATSASRKADFATNIFLLSSQLTFITRRLTALNREDPFARADAIVLANSQLAGSPVMSHVLRSILPKPTCLSWPSLFITSDSVHRLATHLLIANGKGAREAANVPISNQSTRTGVNVFKHPLRPRRAGTRPGRRGSSSICPVMCRGSRRHLSIPLPEDCRLRCGSPQRTRW
jgi:hypothetical protein